MVFARMLTVCYPMTQWLPFQASVACSSVISMDGELQCLNLVYFPFPGSSLDYYFISTW